MSKLLRSTDERGIAVLTLSRPEKGNAYDAEVLRRMMAELEDCAQDASVRVIVLRGAGKHFCVGADLSPAPAATPAATSTAAQRPVGLIDVCLALDTMPKPTIALVQGACIGGGVAFAACCDLVLAERSSFYSIPEVRIGFAPGPLTPFFLRAIGARQLRRYGLSGERFPADEALRLGLVHQLVDSVAADDVIAAAAEGFLFGAPGAIGEFKRTLARVGHEPPTPALLQELQHGFDARHDSEEAIEGRAAFAGKRKPRWYTAPPPSEPKLP